MGLLLASLFLRIVWTNNISHDMVLYGVLGQIISHYLPTHSPISNMNGGSLRLTSEVYEEFMRDLIPLINLPYTRIDFKLSLQKLLDNQQN